MCLTCSYNGKEDIMTEGELAKGKSSREIRTVKSDRGILITQGLEAAEGLWVKEEAKMATF